MYKIFTRNFLIFSLILLVGSTALSLSLISGNKDINAYTEDVILSYETIKEAETLGAKVFNLLYIIEETSFHNRNKFSQLEKVLEQVNDHLNMISQYTAIHESQQQKLAKIKEKIKSISAFANKNTKADVSQKDLRTINEDFLRFHQEFLEFEYKLLEHKVSNLNDKKRRYFTSLLAIVITGTALLFLFNIYLFSAQRKRSAAEQTLQDMEDRLALAFEGTDDGIFDWDIRTNNVYYSARFYSMLGYKHKAVHGNLKNFEELLHPEDVKRVWSYVDGYLNGNINEYNQEFRLKNASGQWVWINARAKGLFDDKGLCYRMVGAHTDISHAKRTQAILKSQKEAAEKANAAKSEFLAHMSHEIRTPLTAISGIAEIFSNKKKEFNDKQKKLIETLRSSTASLKDLINDILDFSKIESQEIVLEEKAFSIHELFKEVEAMMKLRAREKGIEFVCSDKKIKGCTFFGDPIRIRQILVNLITNAIKFTDEGSVSVKAEINKKSKDSQVLVVEVVDTGIGIHKEDQAVIFEKFKQADTSVSRKYGGTGLGLPISRSLAQIMAGEIDLVSSEEGKGSRFRLRLPIRSQETITAQKQEIPRTKENLDKRLRKKAEEGVRILIVEDYEGSITMLGFLFDDLKIQYDVASTGLEALEMWQNQYYDLVLMDVQMPEMDGFTATKKIREIEVQNDFPQTPIIGMTAHALVGDRDKCFEAGMNTYVPKPIVESDLKREMLKFIKPKKKAA